MPWRGAPTTVAASGQRLCAKHRIPLVTANGYMDYASCITPTTETAAVRACSPNAIPLEFSLRRTRYYRILSKVTYCPRCEAELKAQVQFRRQLGQSGI